MSPDGKPAAQAGCAVVFAGPSLPALGYSVPPEITLRPPVRRGDLAGFADTPPGAIGIIDGDFFQNFAVSPREILPLLAAGVPVYGSSSIGALRAVELRHHGMIGVGTVYRLFRRGYLDADDEVAVTWSGETGRRTSSALVDTRWALRRAIRTGLLTAGEAGLIVGAVQQRYFPDRTDELTIHLARELMGPERSERLRMLLNGALTIKERDALLLLRRLERRLSGTSF